MKKKLFSDPTTHADELHKILEALKASGVVIPNDPSLVGKVSSELSKQGTDVSPQGVGGLAVTHYFLVWAS